MSKSIQLKSAIAAVIGTGLLAVTPAISSAHSPAGWHTCPAFDTEPLCDLPTQLASNGSGDRPATVDPLPRRTRSDVHVDVSCTSRPIVLVVACAE
jgi:hypothetical protein